MDESSYPEPSIWPDDDEGVVSFDVDENFTFNGTDATAPNQWFVQFETKVHCPPGGGEPYATGQATLWNPATREEIPLDKVTACKSNGSDFQMMFSLKGMYAAMEVHRGEQVEAALGGEEEDDE